MPKYNVAVYMRLSRDDGDDRESESIENQRDIIESFINQNEELERYSEYVDDGYTGTNFNRPGFKKMLEAIEDGKINCIVTKDLSRFGRDHIDTGYYLERYLPLKNIRYIAIGDDVDTLKSDGLQFLTFKLSFNDYYAQDISNKIKSVKNRKIEKGEFQGGIPPYGYKKDTEIKNHLIIDNESATIVRKIFNMYVNGKSTIEIADILNKEKVLAPGIYLKIPTLMKSSNKDINEYEWHSSQIGKILKNEVYIGNVVGRKFRKVSHKVEKVIATKKEEYIIVENKHEPIIPKDVFEKAQEKLSKWDRVKNGKKNYHPLKDLVYCKECGNKALLKVRTATRKNNKYYERETFVCGRRNSGKNSKCTCSPIETNQLLECVNNVVREEIQKILYTKNDLVELFKIANQESDLKIKEFKEIVKKYDGMYIKKEKMIEEVYNDKLQGIISQEQFNKFYEKLNKEKKEIQNNIYTYNQKIVELEKGTLTIDIEKIEKIGNEFLTSSEPSKEMYNELIEKIEFDSQKKINVVLKFGKISEVPKYEVI